MMQQKSISQRRGPPTKVTGATIPRSDFMIREGRDVRVGDLGDCGRRARPG
jgi:hypothetical protein